jgi:membrane protein implicated in regulation of membrane protease activity
MTNSIYWLLILAVLIFIEIITLGLTTIWFAVGALVAFIISLFFDNLILEIILFLMVSLSLLYFTRPLVLRYIHPKNGKMNYEGVIGKDAVVLITIDNISRTGKVNVEGQEWSARSYEGSVIEEGSAVKIQGISGAKLVVSKL